MSEDRELVTVDKDDLTDLISYLGLVTGMLGEHFPGKAEALKLRYMKFSYLMHDTDSEDCWCCPTIEKHENGNVIIHNRPN